MGTQVSTAAGAQRRGAVILALLFAASGAATMAHEVCWSSIARSVLGADARGIAASLVAILGGMGAGAVIAPRIARRWGALRGFAWVEGAGAVYGLLIPWAAPALDAPVGALFRSFGVASGAGEGGFAIASTVVAALALSPMAIAMGAGLPLLVQASRDAERAPLAAGVLYASHAAGAALGAVATAFVALPAVGVPAIAALAASLQGAVVLGALRTGARDRAMQETAAPPSPIGRGWWVIGAAACSGIATAALQALWSRAAGLAVGPSVQGFALVAALYVLAIAVGAALAAPIAGRARAPGIWLAAVLLGAAVLAVFGLRGVGAWPIGAAEAFREGGPGAGAPWGALGWTLAWPIVPVIALTAAGFPLAVAALRGKSKTAPVRDVGALVAAGALGNVAGVLLATFVLVPAVGLARAIGATAIALVLGALAAAVSSFRGAPGRPAAKAPHAALLVGLSGLAALGLGVAPVRFDPETMSSGPFLYSGPAAPELGEVIFAHEDESALVTVREAAAGERILQVDGKIDGSARGDAPTQILVGLIPALLADDPSRVMVIGLGTGGTADGARAVPGVRRVDVPEIVSGVRWAAPAFARATHRVLDDRRVHVLDTDGALLLRHADREYGVIISEPSNPWVAGMGDLFSRETFAAAKARLARGGVFGAWFHVYATDRAIVREIVATFRAEFPDATLWELARGEDYLLVGRTGSRARQLDVDAIAARAASPEVRARLEQAGIEGAESLLARLVSGGRALRAFERGASPLSARTGNLEARAARALYRDEALDALEDFAALGSPLDDLELRARTAQGAELARAAPRAVEAGQLHRRMVVRALRGDEDAAIAAGERAVGLLPQDPTIRTALATIYLGRGKAHALAREDYEARDVLMTVLELDPPNDLRADALATLGDLDFRAGDTRGALRRYVQAMRLRPDMAELAERIAAARGQM